MNFKQTTCVSIHSFLKFSIFFQPGGPTVKTPARGGLFLARAGPVGPPVNRPAGHHYFKHEIFT
jgi:hypothetical protein